MRPVVLSWCLAALLAGFPVVAPAEEGQPVLPGAAFLHEADPALRSASSSLASAISAAGEKDWSGSRRGLSGIASGCRPLPDSQEKVRVLVTAALLARDLSKQAPSPHARPFLLLAARLFADAALAAERLDDKPLLSLSWGSLGELYMQEERWEEALQLSRMAVFAAQASDRGLLYRWLWQVGRLLRQQNHIDAALLAFREAIASLQAFRGEEGEQCAGRAQFRRQAMELHQEALDLLLLASAGIEEEGLRQRSLREARDLLEALKADELGDYFEDDCLVPLRKSKPDLEAVTRSAAVIYPVSLPDRLELLALLPGGLQRVTVPVKARDLAREVEQFRFHLEKVTTREYLPEAWRLYDWLVRPLEAELARHRLGTLVFVPDGPLLTIPMAALHDGRDFLIGKYALAVVPGLDLSDPRPLPQKEISAFGAGITRAVQGFPPLPHVEKELQLLRELYGGVTLIDEEFRVAGMEEALKATELGILHIASHGMFGRSRAETFLVAYDQKVTLDRLAEWIGLFRFRAQPLEILTLSACQTAAGDGRSALGLAGVAVKAGARSALATLWHINDQVSAELTAEFYRQLRQPGTSRAEALRSAQLAIQAEPLYQHPGFWSPFLLINNWL